MAKARMGRPPKYRKEFCQLAEDFLAQGDTLTQLAVKIGVEVETIHEWRKSHEDFSHSIKRGLNASMAFWEKISKHVSMGIPISVNGEKHRVQNPAMMIFIMKSRFREHYGDQVRVTGGEFDFKDEESLVE